MNIQLFSDLHLEFHTNYPKIKKFAPILILAGDIGKLSHQPYKDFLNYVSNQWSIIIYVFGNHEFYHSKKTVQTLKKNYTNYIQSNYPNIFILDNSYMYIGNYLFIGSILWSYYPSHYPDNIINCITKIKMKDDKGDTKPIGKQGYNILHKTDKQYILDTLSCIRVHDIDTQTNNSIMIHESTKIVIITHYPLCNTNVSNPLFSSPYNSLFQNNILDEISSIQKKYFPNNQFVSVCGHTHYSFDFIEERNNIRCISNQLGYSNEYKEDLSMFNPKGVYSI